MSLPEVSFLFVAVLAVASAFVVILHPHPVYCALGLVITLFQIAVLFVLLDAHMLAFLQILVYAGAIMVLFLFVIMLLNLQHESEPAPPGWKWVALGTASLLGAELALFFLRHPGALPQSEAVSGEYGTVGALGRSLFTDHVLSFELTSVLLLIAVVGAVVLAKRGDEPRS